MPRIDIYLQYLKKIENTKNSFKIIQNIRKSWKSLKTMRNVAIIGNPNKHQNYIWKHVKIKENNGKSNPTIESYKNHWISNRKP